MITVHVINQDIFTKKLDTVREAIIYRAGIHAIYGEQYETVILDKHGYIVPDSEIRGWLANMLTPQLLKAP